MIKLILLFLLGISRSEVITLTSNNFVSIVGEVNENMVKREISLMNTVETDPMYIYIKTNGGSVSAGADFIQYLNYVKVNKTVTCIADTALSMGFNIFQHCSERLVLPSSVVMQHQVSLRFRGSLENINSYLQMINNMNNEMITLESSRLQINKDEYKKKIDNDWWIYGGQNIINNKIADRLIVAVGCDNEIMSKYITSAGEFGIKVNTPLCPLVR